jgi:23S rRNA G2445 N2-methylase RlmL
MSNDLKSRLQDPGFTPAQRDFDALCELLTDPDRKLAELVERALARAGTAAAKHAQARFASAPARERARLVNVISRVAQSEPQPEFAASILQALDDSDAKTRRNAIIALGKIQAPDAEARLLALWNEAPIEQRRSLVEALGKIGGSASREFLNAVQSDDAELTRLLGRARLMLARTAQRETPGRILLDRKLPREQRLVFRCRAGLARILAAEAAAVTESEIRNPTCVGFRWSGTAAELLRVRTALDFGIVLKLEQARSEEESIARTLLRDDALGAMQAWTSGTPRFRLSFVAAGHRRAQIWKIAEHISKLSSAIVNDSTDSTWEALVSESQVLLVPTGFEDPRFAYRKADVPAASHPTLAAALARTAQVVTDDVVWDPFVGSGLELIERARLGPFKRLYGSDLESTALEAARQNLRAAELEAELTRADARRHHPPGITLVISNPPMGRRVARDGTLGVLLSDFLRHAFRVLVPGGRLVWLSPLDTQTAEAGKAAGFSVERLEAVDMGGFDAELQVLRKPGSLRRGG